MVEVGTEDAGQGFGRDGNPELSGDPFRLARRWIVGVAAVEDDGCRMVEGPTKTEIEGAGDAGADDFGGQRQVLAGGEQVDEGFPMGGIRAPAACLEERGDQREVLRSPPFREGGASDEDFLRMARVQIGGEFGDDAASGAHGEGTPGLAGAEGIQVTGPEVGDHLLRRNDDEAVVPVRHESCIPEPMPEKVGLGGMRIDDAENERFLGLRGESADDFGRRNVRPGPMPARDDDDISMQVQDQGRDAVTAYRAEPESHGEGHRTERLGSIEFAAEQLLANGGPPDLAGEPDLQAMLTEEPVSLRDPQGRGVDQGDEAEAQQVRGSAGGGRDRDGRRGSQRRSPAKADARFLAWGVPGERSWRDEC